MTLAGTVLGIASLVATVGLSQTAASQVAAQFSAAEATHLTAAPSRAETSAGDSVDVTTLPWDAVDRIQRLAGVRTVALSAEVIREGGTVTSVAINDPSIAIGVTPRVTAATPQILDALDAPMSTGRTFDSGHDARGDRVALLGHSAANSLNIGYLGSQPSIFIDGLSYSVIGIFEDPAFAAELSNEVVIPLGTARKDFVVDHVDEAIVRIAIGSGPQLQSQIASTLSPNDPQLIAVAAPPAVSSLGTQVQSDLSFVFVVLSAVVLLAGGLGIANITMLSVSERVSEIGLRRALGATRRQIAAQFLMESTLIGLLGGLVGASLGVVALVVLAMARGWTPVLEPNLALVGALGGAAIGSLAGWWPSSRAGRVEPIRALREG